MGVQSLGDLVVKRPVAMEELSGRTLAIDALNYLYAFLSVIRQPDGTPLTDSKNRTTSHLSGLFYRSINLLESNIKPIFVFDGEPPELKKETIAERRAQRKEAKEKWEDALAAGDVIAARKYAQFALSLNEQMIHESQDLWDYSGIPRIQAPSEGEAQAAHMAATGLVWAAASQDYDSLLFGAPRLVRNLAITGRRKLPRKPVYVKINPELV